MFEHPTWIRRTLMQEMLERIQAPDSTSYIFYLTGAGGMGKTVLLRYLGMELGSPDGMVPAARWSGILDLYHPDVNSNSGLERHLKRALELDGEFLAYERKREEYDAQRRAGVSGTDLEKLRRELADVFAQCMNLVTAQRRVVIAFDTTEKIQYEYDEIQALCNLSDESTTVKAWLLEQLARWKNCVVILAGRQESHAEYLKAGLEARFSASVDPVYLPYALGGFNEPETDAFYAKQTPRFPVIADLDAGVRSQLAAATDHSPLRMELALEVMQHAPQIGPFLQVLQSNNAARVRDEIDRRLVDFIMQDLPDFRFRTVLRDLAIARKGLDASLLHLLENDWSEQECQLKLDAFAQRSFVKPRPQDKRLFLHDEMYDLCERALLFDTSEIQAKSRQLVASYEHRTGARVDAIDSLLYRLRADPYAGYDWYLREAETAIRNTDIGFELSLRSELFSFLYGTSPANREIVPPSSGLRESVMLDSAALWEKRFIMRGEMNTAIDIAERVKSHLPGEMDADNARLKLSLAGIDLYHGEALMHVDFSPKATDLLWRVAKTLENRDPLSGAGVAEMDSWRWDLILGRTYNDLGYAYWKNFFKYNFSIDQFSLSLPHFRRVNLREEMANTADNIARVYALLYDRNMAEAMVEDALNLRLKLGSEYRIGLSWNSRAIICTLFDQLEEARIFAERALNIFDGIPAQRGIGLACISLGQALRNLGKQWEVGLHSHDDYEKNLRQSREYLTRAIEIFTDKVHEPVRHIEALNERACSFRESAALALEGEKRNPTFVPQYGDDPEPASVRSLSQKALDDFEMSMSLAGDNGMPVMFVDSCEDLARLYFLRGKFDDSLKTLERAERRVPVEYKIQVRSGLQPIPPAERVEEFWHLMGKIEILRGHIAFDRENKLRPGDVSRDALTTATEHYALGARYFEEFSPFAVAQEVTFKQIYSRFKHSPLPDVEYIQTQILPAIQERYQIKASTLATFFENTFGVRRRVP